ncbi:hypothetical protein N431DRAFT_443567 [Stipitochalara longipes BDJ]|nr:hypothetical protein N431DRAFT_443567 [Stipitochalara longipes BDJ]
MFVSIEDFYFEHASLLAEAPAPLDSEEKEDRHQAVKRRLISRYKGFLEIPACEIPRSVAQPQQQRDDTETATAEAFITQWCEEMGPAQEIRSNSGVITNNQNNRFSTDLSIRCPSILSPQNSTRLSSKPRDEEADPNWRNDNGATGFVDLAAQYDMPLYILQTIKSALKDAAPDNPDNPDIHTCLFHVVRDYKAHADRGADPNKYHNSVTPFEVVLSEAVEASHDAAITEKKRSLEHWALVIEEFIKHNANLRANKKLHDGFADQGGI